VWRACGQCRWTWKARAHEAVALKRGVASRGAERSAIWDSFGPQKSFFMLPQRSTVELPHCVHPLLVRLQAPRLVLELALAVLALSTLRGELGVALGRPLRRSRPCCTYRPKPSFDSQRCHSIMYDTCSIAVDVCRWHSEKLSVAPSTAAAHAASPVAPAAKSPRTGIWSRSTVPAGSSLSIEAVGRPCCAFVASLLPRSLASADSMDASAAR